MDLKLLLIVATMSAVIGSCFGVTITAKHYRTEIAQMQTEAIKAEHEATVKQLNIEHEWQAKQEQADKEATDEINKIKENWSDDKKFKENELYINVAEWLDYIQNRRFE